MLIIVCRVWRNKGLFLILLPKQALQAEDLNIIDATTMISATVEDLKRINQDAAAMDEEIQAAFSTRKI